MPALKLAHDFMAAFEKIGEPGDPPQANDLPGAPRIRLDHWLKAQIHSARFFRRLTSERSSDYRFAARQAAGMDVPDAIACYPSFRHHTTLGYKSVFGYDSEPGRLAATFMVPVYLIRAEKPGHENQT